MSESEKTNAKEQRGVFTGSAGTWRCGEWCRHFEPLDEERWPGFGRCLHPLSLRHGQVFRLRDECSVGEAERDLGGE